VDQRLEVLLLFFPRMLLPFITILPGLAALTVMPEKIQGNYNMVMPLMLLKYYPAGLLGVGMTALLASFMSGMAGNVTAFNTVWTYDIYQSYINKKASDEHYLWMGRMATIFGIALSVATAYMATRFNNIMDMLQLVFAFVNAPLLATFLLGMFWKLGQTPALPDDNGLFWRITQHAGAQLLPNVSSHVLVATHVFLEMLHYGVWLVALAWNTEWTSSPLVDSVSESSS
jgi:SSS family solute:Na+ symporter